MKGKLTPHIITVTAFVVFIVLGLACASAPVPKGFGVESLYGTWVSPDKRKIYSISEKEIITLTFDGAGKIASQHTALIKAHKTWENSKEEIEKGYPIHFEFIFEDKDILLGLYKGMKHHLYPFSPSADNETMMEQKDIFKRADDIIIADLTKDVNWATVHTAPFKVITQSSADIGSIDGVGFAIGERGIIKISEGTHTIVGSGYVNNGRSVSFKFTLPFKKDEHYVLENFGGIVKFRTFSNAPLIEGTSILIF